MSYISGKRKSLSFIGLFLLSIFLFWGDVFANGFWYDPNFRAPQLEWTFWGAVEDYKIEMEVLIFLSAVAKMIMTFFWLFWAVISWFLSPEWLNGQVFWLWIWEIFRSLWIMVSNVVYMVFAIIFVWIAFISIVWVQSANYELKKSLPKLILWVLMVPLTWFIVQFVISLTSVLTYSVMYLAVDSFQEVDKKEYTQYIDMWAANSTVSSYETIYNSEIEDPIASKWAYAIVWHYLYWLISPQEIDILHATVSDSPALETVWDFVSLLKQIGVWLLNVIALIVLGLIFLMIFVALLARIIHMWIYIVFSPVLALSYFFWADENSFFKKVNFKEFLALAMVPVYVSWALSLWILFLTKITTSVTDGHFGFFNVLSSYSWGSWSAEAGTDSILQLGGQDWTVIVFKWVDLFSHSWDFWWSALWIVITYMIWICFMWVAVLSALKTSTVTWAAVAQFETMWKNVAWFAKAIPWNTPLLGKAWHSLDSISYGIQSMTNTVNQSAAARQSKYERKIREAFWVEGTTAQDILEIKNKLVNWAPQDVAKAIETIRNHKKKLWRNHPQIKEMENMVIETINNAVDNGQQARYRDLFTNQSVWLSQVEKFKDTDDINFLKVMAQSYDSKDTKAYYDGYVEQRKRWDFEDLDLKWTMPFSLKRYKSEHKWFDFTNLSFPKEKKFWDAQNAHTILAMKVDWTINKIRVVDWWDEHKIDLVDWITPAWLDDAEKIKLWAAMHLMSHEEKYLFMKKVFKLGEKEARKSIEDIMDAYELSKK